MTNTNRNLFFLRKVLIRFLQNYQLSTTSWQPLSWPQTRTWQRLPWTTAMYYSGHGILANIFLTFLKKWCKPIISFSCDIKKAGKWHYRVKSWVIFNKCQFTHICQLNVSCSQDSMSRIVHKWFRNKLRGSLIVKRHLKNEDYK
jgi:hypothetical protein